MECQQRQALRLSYFSRFLSPRFTVEGFSVSLTFLIASFRLDKITGFGADAMMITPF
jgi:hypothetical protein